MQKELRIEEEAHRDRMRKAVFLELNEISLWLGFLAHDRSDIPTEDDLDGIVGQFERPNVEYYIIPYDTRIALLSSEVFYLVQNSYNKFEVFKKILIANIGKFRKSPTKGNFMKVVVNESGTKEVRDVIDHTIEELKATLPKDFVERV